MNTEWHALRATGIGGSDLAAVLGLSKWKTPLQLYREKRGECEDQPDNEPMRWGRALEDVIRQRYAEETGATVEVPGHMRHPVHSFIVGHLDGIATLPNGQTVVLEIKTARHGEGWGEEGTDEIPQEYLLQVQHYLFVAGLDQADVAVLIAGSDFRIYRIKADAELQAMLLDACREFWQRVQDGNPPAPMSAADCQSLWPAPQRDEREASADTVAKVAELAAVRAQIADLESQKESLETAIKSELADASDLTYGGRTLATWRSVKGRTTLDAKRLEQERPDVFATYARQGTPYRRFLLKGEK